MNYKEIVFKVLIPLLLVTGAFVFPPFELGLDISTLLTVVSLIFAVLVGFFIATATTNYLNLRNLIADDDGALIIIHNIAKMVDPSREKELAEAIDEYVTSALDYELDEYQEKTRDKYKKVIEILDSLEPADDQKKRIAALSYLHETKSNSFKTRQLIPLAAERVISNLHWFIMGLLTILIVVFLYALRSDHWFSETTAAILSLSTYLILILLNQIDSNVFDEELYTFKNTQKVFEAIGKPHYYPDHAIRSGRIKSLPPVYRVGYFDPANPDQKEIKLVGK